MTGLTAFGVGIAVGYLLSVFVAVLLMGRGEFPYDERYDDEPDDDPPTLLDGWHGRAGP
ncbi:MAG TPA: hypothetical protein VFR23_19435 [Jiangellaceae bacterium]|nr:hypothetical protein [Jiangellaceae bacterium]